MWRGVPWFRNFLNLAKVILTCQSKSSYGCAGAHSCLYPVSTGRFLTTNLTTKIRSKVNRSYRRVNCTCFKSMKLKSGMHTSLLYC